MTAPNPQPALLYDVQGRAACVHKVELPLRVLPVKASVRRERGRPVNAGLYNRQILYLSAVIGRSARSQSLNNEPPRGIGRPDLFPVHVHLLTLNQGITSAVRLDSPKLHEPQSLALARISRIGAADKKVFLRLPSFSPNTLQLRGRAPFSGLMQSATQ